VFADTPRRCSGSTAAFAVEALGRVFIQGDARGDVVIVAAIVV
jgi:hypothetical protein